MAKKGETSFSLYDYNKDYQMRKFGIGDRVSVYDVPCKAKRKKFDGIIMNITHESFLGVFADVLPDGKPKTIHAFIYGGKQVPYDQKL